MKNLLYTHHGNLMNVKNAVETLRSESNDNEKVVSGGESKTMMTGQITTSQHNNEAHFNDNKSFNHLPRELLSYADDNFVELNHVFLPEPRFTTTQDYFKDEHFVKEILESLYSGDFYLLRNGFSADFFEKLRAKEKINIIAAIKVKYIND